MLLSDVIIDQNFKETAGPRTDPSQRRADFIRLGRSRKCEVVELFNLGAPAQSWQLQTTRGQLLLQPPASDRSSPPAVMFRAIGDAPTVQMTLDIGTAKFERLVIAHDLGNTKLAPAVTLASPEIWVIAGDNQQELLDLAVSPSETLHDGATPE